ncbi:MAG: hypothetical protein KC503_20585 [Myxococcales bacterium]|nr:hypothetical protein [Myxococcales bacterium]
MSGRQCAYYEVTVEEFGPPDGVGWVTRHVGREMKDFFVRDSTARARVCPSSPTVMLDIDEKVVPQFFKKRPPSVQRLLDQLPDVTIDDPECVCIREGVLEAGETITVMGGCYWEADEAQHMYRDMGRRLVIGATDEGDMFLSDRKIKR